MPPTKKSAKLRLEAAKVGAKINDFHWGHLPCSDDAELAPQKLPQLSLC